MNIPSNYTLAECLKYIEMPEELREQLDSRLESLEELLTEADRVLTEIYGAVAETFEQEETKELAESIKSMLDDSFFEL